MNELNQHFTKMAYATLLKMEPKNRTRKMSRLIAKTLKENYYKLSEGDKVRFREEMKDYE